MCTKCILKVRERELYFSELFSKLDLPLFRGPFLSILQHNKARVGGWDFHSTQICFFKQVIVFIIVTMLVLFKFCITWNNLQRFAFSGMNTYPYHHACFNLNQIISTHTENLSVWYKQSRMRLCGKFTTKFHILNVQFRNSVRIQAYLCTSLVQNRI